MELACVLAGEVVRSFGEVRLCAFGTSMAPSILPGDLLVIQRTGIDEISPGEVVLFSREDRLFIHRVVERKVAERKVSSSAESLEERVLITRGDRLGQDDPPVSSRELLGRVVRLERGHRKIELPARRDDSRDWVVRLLRASDRATYLYILLAACRRTIHA